MTWYPAQGSPAGALLVLAHGAGAGQRHPFMVAYARGIAERGVDVVTFDFPYMAEKRRIPDKAPVLEAAFRQAIAEARRDQPAGRLFVGGKSMGGRIATHLAAQPDPPCGVVALGYPLHPPGKPEQKRVAHFPGVGVPCLFVQGERDAFGTPLELEPELKAMQRYITLTIIRGGDHSLNVRGRSADSVREEVVAAIAAWMARV
jgi:predicted alpha/beta-hydrolase family hydrolase